MLSFYLISNNEGNAGTNVNFSVDVWDGAAWNSGVYASNSNTLNGEWQQVSVVLSSLTITGPVQLRFIVDEDPTGNFYDDVAIDDVTFVEAPACPDPTMLSAANITTASADLGWTENGTATSWEVEYDSTGFVQGTGNTVVTGTNPHALTGLTANYSYDFYVRAICGVGDSSAWDGPYSFITPCNTAAITYTQDFTTWPMQCWDLTGGSQSWSDNGSGIALANFWSWPNPTDAIMSTEPIDISVDARVRFDWSHLYSATYPLDSLSVDVKVLPGGTWTSIWGKGGSDLESNDGAGNTTPGSMVTETILLDPATYTGQDVQVRFVATSGYGPDLFVDNLIIEPVPACVDPSGLTASNITTVSADLGWTENGTATSWEVEYDSTGFVQGTGNTVVTGTNPHALAGLTANYSYDFYVRAICGVGDSSVWVGPYSFNTPCNAVTVFPFIESFEDSSATRNCWTNIQAAGAADWTYDTGSSGGAILNAYSGTKNARFVSASGAGTPATKLVSPEMDLTSISNPRVVFYYGQEEWTPDQNYTHLLYRDNPAAAWTMIWSDSTNVNAWTEAIVTLPSPSATYQIAFEGINNWGRANVVDEVVVEEAPTCSVDLGADTTLCSGQDSVMLDAGAGPYTYEWTTLETTQTIVVSSSTAGTSEYSVLITDTISMCQAIDSVNVTFDDCSNISELTGSNVSIYPNPSNGNFIVSLSNISEQVSVQVVDMQGRLIYSQIEGLKVGKENIISLENVERGVYLISVSSNKGRYTQSIVIQ
jgi:hypothetical protein